MRAAVLAMVLLWDQPYPAPGQPSADGVRCYYHMVSGWTSYETAPNGGPCHPDNLIASAQFTGAHRFMVRGYRGTIESGNSNEWRLCACDMSGVQPPPNHATDGLCVVYAWPCGDVECLDRSEFVACVTGAT